MKCKLGFVCCLIAFLMAACTNNKNQHLNSTNQPDSSQANYLEEKKQDTVIAIAKNDKMENDSLSNYDAYQFTNDTLVQDVYISYIAPKQIKFLVRTKNRISLHKCEYSSTAMMANGEGTAQGSDELNDDELYGVYEYFTKGHPFFTIDVEFKRGKRMTVFTKDDKARKSNRGSTEIINFNLITRTGFINKGKYRMRVNLLKIPINDPLKFQWNILKVGGSIFRL